MMVLLLLSVGQSMWVLLSAMVLLLSVKAVDGVPVGIAAIPHRPILILSMWCEMNEAMSRCPP
eukprot:930385-Pyramimonas_sp.AAC.1